MIAFVVEDRPAPQGSKKVFPNGGMVESSKHVGTWREAVKTAAVERKRQQYGPKPPGLIFPQGVPVKLRIVFYHRRPKAHYRTGKHSTELKPGVPEFVAKKPDLSKLIRSTEDAITAAGIWHDDSQVASIVTQQKYSDTGFEGAEIEVTEVGP
jgi:crossover junction endodeoxyribonuclease RusA